MLRRIAKARDKPNITVSLRVMVDLPPTIENTAENVNGA